MTWQHKVWKLPSREPLSREESEPFDPADRRRQLQTVQTGLPLKPRRPAAPPPHAAFILADLCVPAAAAGRSGRIWVTGFQRTLPVTPASVSEADGNVCVSGSLEAQV